VTKRVEICIKARGVYKKYRHWNKITVRAKRAITDALKDFTLVLKGSVFWNITTRNPLEVSQKFGIQLSSNFRLEEQAK
jgi:hypothetical protein